MQLRLAGKFEILHSGIWRGGSCILKTWYANYQYGSIWPVAVFFALLLRMSSISGLMTSAGFCWGFDRALGGGVDGGNSGLLSPVGYLELPGLSYLREFRKLGFGALELYP